MTDELRVIDGKLQVEGMARVIKLLEQQIELLKEISRKLDRATAGAQPPRRPAPRRSS